MGLFSILHLFQRDPAVYVVAIMKYLRGGDIFQVAITLMGFIGENMRQTSLKLFSFRLVNCVIQVFIAIFIFANFLYVEGGMYVNTLEDLITVLHVKLIHQPSLKSVLNWWLL